MGKRFPLAPRYRLDDEHAWMIGVDPLRRYWIALNGDDAMPVIIPGFSVAQFDAFREAIIRFRNLHVGESAQFPTAMGVALTVECISNNCFAIASEVNGCAAYHLFDQETLESLLMTAHPDWRCAPHHRDLGRQMLSLSWEQPAATKAA